MDEMEWNYSVENVSVETNQLIDRLSKVSCCGFSFLELFLFNVVFDRLINFTAKKHHHDGGFTKGKKFNFKGENFGQAEYLYSSLPAFAPCTKALKIVKVQPTYHSPLLA